MGAGSDDADAASEASEASSAAPLAPSSSSGSSSAPITTRTHKSSSRAGLGLGGGGSGVADAHVTSTCGWIRARRRQALAGYLVVPTPLRSAGATARLHRVAAEQGSVTACRMALSAVFADLWFLMRLRALWRVVLMALAALVLGSQWAANEMMLPPFLKRVYGEGTPIYAIVSINLWGCMVLPPVVGALTSKHETFRVALPGMWLMALSPLCLVVSPTPAAAVWWNVLLTIGEVFWSPRNSAWQASLAPTGREGLFLALASTRAHLAPLLDLLVGHLNEALNPNCPQCRDAYGHFCARPRDEDDPLASCGTQHGECPVPGNASRWPDADGACPSTCHGCPGWHLPGEGRYLWLALLALSLCAPLLVWAALPFLRGEGEMGRGCYGVCSWRRCCLWWWPGTATATPNVRVFVHGAGGASGSTELVRATARDERTDVRTSTEAAVLGGERSEHRV